MAGNQSKLLSRRAFARRAALFSASAAILPESSLLSAHAKAAVAQLPENLPKLSPEAAAEAEARFQLVLSRHGARLNEEDKRNIRMLIHFSQPGLERLRAFSLNNGDVPALFLKPIVERAKIPPANRPKSIPAAAAKNS